MRDECSPGMKKIMLFWLFVTIYDLQIDQNIDDCVRTSKMNKNKEASRLYAELLLCVCWDTEHI